jgi:hypothetical protein
MTKTYTQIISGFTKLITQCEANMDRLLTTIDKANTDVMKHEYIADTALNEHTKTENLVKKLKDMIGV